MYQQMENGESKLSFDDIMRELGISRWCCKRMLKTSVNVTEKVLDYKRVHDVMNANPYVTFKTKSVDSTIRTYSTN